MVYSHYNYISLFQPNTSSANESKGSVGCTPFEKHHNTDQAGDSIKIYSAAKSGFIVTFVLHLTWATVLLKIKT